jgi:DNA-binding CsgD family transcriptional regulator
LNTGEIKKILDINSNTANILLKQMVKLNVVKKYEIKRFRIYKLNEENYKDDKRII